MKLNWKKGFATFLTILMMVQLLPASLVTAIAEGIDIIFASPLSFDTYYTVKFVRHDDTSAADPIVTQLVLEGEAAAPPQDPTREATAAEGNVAWRFDAWVSEPTGVLISSITKDVVFRATYTELKMTPFTVNYVLDTPDPTVVLPPRAIRYFQVGQTADVSITAPTVPGYKPVPDPVTYNGVMGDNPALETVTVTYEKQPDLNYTVKHWFETDDAVPNNQDPVPGTAGHFTLDSSLGESGTVAYGGTVALTDKAKPGYTMITQAQEPTTTDNKVYDVYYKKNLYTLTYDSNATEASVPDPVSIKSGNKITLPATNPTRTGYTFAGWFPNADGTGTQCSTSDRMPAGDMTIYGKWTGNSGVSYKIVHWVERPNFSGTPTPGNMDEYIYHSETTGLTGVAGTTVAQSVIDANKKSITVPSTTKVYAEYQGYDDQTALAGDGTTVINVYYKRYLFTYVFSPTNGSYIGRFPGLAESATKTYQFKYEQYLLNFADPNNSWPYPSSGNEPEYRYGTSGTYNGTYKLVQWNFPTSYPINRRDILAADMVPATPTTVTNVGISASTTYVSSSTTRTYDLYYFERLPDQTTATNTNGANYRTVSSTTVIADGIEGYSRLILGTTGHNTSLAVTGCSFISCNHNTAGSSGTYAYGKTYLNPEDGKTYSIYEVYMSRNRYDFTFDKNTSATSVTAPAKMSQQMYGLKYANWPTATLTALQNWVPGVSPSYTDASGVTFTFTGWHEYPEVERAFVVDSTSTIPAQNITLYAHWKTVDVTVTLRVNNVVTDTVILPAYSLLSGALPATDPVKVGYTFTGWFNSGVRYDGSFVLRSDITLDAVFTAKPTAYTVKCVDESNVDIRLARKVTGKHVDDVIDIPGDEAPPHIAGYTLVSTTPASGSSLTLVEDENSNVITFKYKVFEGYEYVVRYVLESDTTVNVFPPDDNLPLTPAEQLIIWAKKDPTLTYYPIEESKKVEMDANGVTTVTFLYREYKKVTYTEQSILVDSPIPDHVIYQDLQKTARIGQSVTHSDTTPTYTYNGSNYDFDEALTARLDRGTVKTDSDVIVLKRYYSIYRIVKFVAGLNGSLTGTQSYTVPKYTLWSDITVPTPVPNEGYWFSGWSATFPATITQDATYTANFTQKQTITIRSNGLNTTYNGSAQSVSGFQVLNSSNVVITNLTVTGITTSNPSATIVGTYANTIGNRNAIKIMEGTTDVTERYTVAYVEQNLVINKMSLTVSGVTETVEYTGSFIGGKYTPTTIVSTGHTVQAVANGGGVATGTYTITVNVGDVKVLDGTNNDVTSNYTITTNTGTLTITDATAKIPITIKAPNDSKPFTGSEVTTTLTTGATVTVGTLPNGGTIEFTATGSGVATGTYDITFTAGPKIMIGSVDVTDQYTVTTQKGTLTINKLADPNKIKLTVTGASVSYDYTGNPITVTQTATNATVSGAGAPLPSGVTLKFAASRTETVDGVYDITITECTLWVGTTEVTENYDITKVAGKLKIEKGSVRITVKPNDVASDFTGHEITVTNGSGTVTVGTLPVGVTMTMEASGSGFSPGTYDILANTTTKLMLNSVDVTDNYVITELPGKLTINAVTGDKRIPLTVTADNAQDWYTGSLISVSVDGTAPVGTGAGQLDPAFTLVATGKGSGVVPGGYPITIAETDVKITHGNKDITSNYVITRVNGTLTINKLGIDPDHPTIALKIQANDDTKVFNGTTQTVEPGGKLSAGYTLPSGLALTVYSKGSGNLPDTYPIEIDMDQAKTNIKYTGTVPIPTGSSADVTENYAITPRDGTLAITQSRLVIEITVNSVSTPFISAALQAKNPTTGAAAGVTVVPLGGPAGTVGGTVTSTTQLPAGYTLTEVVAESAVVYIPGAYDIAYKSARIMYNDGVSQPVDATSNFDITGKKGTLTVTPLTGSDRIAVNVTADSTTRPYTGKQITVNLGATTTNPPIDGTNFKLAATSQGTGFIPGHYPVEVKTAKVMFGNTDVSENYIINHIDGNLEILTLDGSASELAKLKIDVTPDSISEEYTGQLIQRTVTTGTVTSGGPLDSKLSLDVKASGQGLVPDVYPTTIAVGDAKIIYSGTDYPGTDVSSNYEITRKDGTLTITAVKIPITVAPIVPSTWVYNGTQQGFASFDGDVTFTDTSLSLPAGATVTINKSVYGTNAGDYPIQFTASNVTIMLGTTNLTSNYIITPISGKMTIEKLKLYGIITANDPDPLVYTYGTVPQPGTNPTPYGWVYDQLSQMPAAGDSLNCSIVGGDQNAADPNHTFDVGIHWLWPLLGNNPNYDTSEIVTKPSTQITVNKAELKVTPLPAKMPYGATDPDAYGFVVDGLKFNDTAQSIGLNSVVKFSNSASSTSPIGKDAYDIFLAKIGDLQNYDLIVEDLPNGLSIYGQVEYHGNYLDGTDLTKYDGEYYDENEPVNALNPHVLGLFREGLKFLQWTYDAAGDDLYDESDPIGSIGTTLYAQWVEVYRLTVYHRLEDGTEIALPTIVWLERGEVYQFKAIENPLYEAIEVLFDVDGVTYSEPPYGYIRMPKQYVDATIYYRQLTEEEVLERIRRLQGEGIAISYFTILDDDIPLSGIGGKNMGDCFE